MASFCRTGLANCGLLQTHSAALGLQQCAERVFLPMICCPVCEKRNYVASLIYFDFLFCSLLQIWRQPLEYKSVLPFCFVFQILLSYSNLQKHPRMFAGHLFAKRVRWPWTHTDRVVIVLTTCTFFSFFFCLLLACWPAAVSWLILSLWFVSDVMVWWCISLTAVFAWCHVLSSMLHYIWLRSGPLGLTVSHIICNVNLVVHISICLCRRHSVLHLWLSDDPH